MSRGALVACVIGLGLCAATWAVAGPTEAEAAERQQIQRERADVEARFSKGQAECAKRFVVTSCVDALQVERREALAALREREIVLDETQRRRDAEEGARRIAEKQAEAQARPPPEPRAPAAPRASAPTPTQSERAKWRSKTADDAAEAAARVVAQQRRASEAAARREEAQGRQAERDAKGKKSTPLPIPPPLPPASAASR